ncbi:MAG: hypothetical protein K0S74_484 [Chlamydiales bacterium]|nr:hypothetical protein [Chlamydiales bacterium]
MSSLLSTTSAGLFNTVCNALTNNFFRDTGEAVGYSKLAPTVVSTLSKYVDKSTGPFAPLVKAALGGKVVKKIYQESGQLGAAIGGLFPSFFIQTSINVALFGSKIYKDYQYKQRLSQEVTLKGVEWKKETSDGSKWEAETSKISKVKKLFIDLDDRDDLAFWPRKINLVDAKA